MNLLLILRKLFKIQLERSKGSNQAIGGNVQHLTDVDDTKFIKRVVK